MPAPQASLMKQAARLKFSSFNLKVPQNWRQPQGEDGDHFAQAFKDNEKSTTPDTTIPPLFQPASLNKYHTDTQKQHNRDIGGFIDKTCDAICSAWGNWQSLATIIGVIVAGPVATFGQVLGPPLTPLILAQGAKATPMQLKYTTAIANVIGTAWLTYTATIKVPGLAWYPSFTACPMPVAPPTPNVPVPVAALAQVPASLAPPLMKQQMVGMLADPRAPFHGQLFEAICDAFDKMFKAWQLSTQVTNVLATGPVPTMAAPVPVPGPVVGGIGAMPPGGFK